MADLDLVIAGKSIHEGEEFNTGIDIDDLIDKGSREVFFGTSLVYVTKVCENSNGTLFFIDMDRIGDLGCVSDRVYEASCT
jgi:hypothetical protein